MKLQLVKEVIYFLKFLEQLRKQKKKYLTYTKNGKPCFEKKKYKLFYLYIKYEFINFNLNQTSNQYSKTYIYFIKKSQT